MSSLKNSDVVFVNHLEGFSERRVAEESSDEVAASVEADGAESGEEDVREQKSHCEKLVVAWVENIQKHLKVMQKRSAERSFYSFEGGGGISQKVESLRSFSRAIDASGKFSIAARVKKLEAVEGLFGVRI
ncbi:hypothetical protein L596_018526 [Steinernema carpocapsae]|uniref:Uncharacterized protein n=1 Tax=Steinernema carpocapsae TaxID=34508 RepID=A0A4U5N5E6_STECR|nr:hypothetical protein L596_018526 [Steinernema carpocapsae]